MTTYQVTEVADAIGIKRTALHSWLDRRVVDIGVKRPGTGLARELTADQIMQLAIIAELTKAGCSLAQAVAIKGGYVGSPYVDIKVRWGYLEEDLFKKLRQARRDALVA